MEDQSNQSFYTILNTIIGTYFKLFSEIVKIINLEALLASQSLVKIIILSSIAFVIVISTWLCVLVLLFFCLTSLHCNWLLATSIITLFNILILLIILIVIFQLKKNLSFSATRRQISNISITNKERINERIETTDKTT